MKVHELTRAVAFAAFLFSSTAGTIGSAKGVGMWPIVKRIEREKTFSNLKGTARDTPFILSIEDLNGIPVYTLECHNGDHESGTGFNYSGDFHCALFAVTGGVRTSWNLLATTEGREQESDWLNRGRMTARQLWGRCGDLPEYGRLRRFRLRHMQIVFRYSNLHFVSKRAGQRALDAFTFKVSVAPDSTADTSSAGQVKKTELYNECNATTNPGRGGS
jgi:hypothetical protein